MNMMKRIIRRTTPVSLRRLIARYRGRTPPPPPPDWEAMEAWNPRSNENDAGWNAESVVHTQIERWNGFRANLAGPGPLGVSHESPPSAGRENTWAHNLIMTYGYVLALAAHQKSKLSILDWGGGAGHYYEFSRSLLPVCSIDYTCSDLLPLIKAGRSLSPEINFVEAPDEGLDLRYDLVMAGSSLWYAEDWRHYAARLATCSNEWLYITRMMFVDSVASFPAVQRPWKFGYNTEYQCWILNRFEFVEEVSRHGMTLFREFVFGAGPEITNAPEQGIFRGFLFRRS